MSAKKSGWSSQYLPPSKMFILYAYCSEFRLFKILDLWAISCSNLTDDEVRQVFSAPGAANFQNITITGTHLSDLNIFLSSQQQPFLQLVHLNVSGNQMAQITSPSATAEQQKANWANSFAQIRVLDLSRNLLTVRF